MRIPSVVRNVRHTKEVVELVFQQISFWTEDGPAFCTDINMQTI